MDINKRISNFLIEQGCTITIANGIWYIKTPSGEIWNMTNPEKVEIVELIHARPLLEVV